MSRNTFIIRNDIDRKEVSRLVAMLPRGAHVEIQQNRRTLEQNAKMWAMARDISDQVPWTMIDGNGDKKMVKLPPEDWKFMFLDAQRGNLRLVSNLDGTGVVSLPRSSRRQTVAEMADMITDMERFGAEHGVKFKDSSDSSQADADRTDAPGGSRGPQPSEPSGASY